MNGSSGAGQNAVGGVGGAMAATSRPASVPALPVGGSTTDNVVGGLGKGLMGFSSLMSSQAAPAALNTPAGRGTAAPQVADYSIPNEDPFAKLQKMDPSYLKALMGNFV